MAYQFPSEEWLLALKEVLNSNARYAEIAKNWEGDLQFLIEPAQASVAEEPISLYLDLWHGVCRDAVYMPPKDSSLLPKFTLQAPLKNFLAILNGELDPMQAMLTRRLRVKGDMAYMLRNIPTVLQFVHCAQMVEIQPNP